MSEQRSKTDPRAVETGDRNGSSRRSLLKKGLFGGAILLVGGAASMFFRAGQVLRRPHRPLRVFSPAEFAIFAAAAARLCPGGEAQKEQPASFAAVAWPASDSESIDCAGKVDALLTSLHPKASADFRKLLHVFENALTGVLVMGSPMTFTRSTAADQDRRLDAWRHSRVAVFRSGYQAMKRLAHAAYYSSPETYALVGYPGPPIVPQVPA